MVNDQAGHIRAAPWPGRRPSSRMRMMGWLAIGSCAPLVGSAWNPPLWAVLLLWTLAGAGGAYQLAAASAFVRALEPGTRARAFGVAQSGLYAVQGLGIPAGGAVAQAIGAPLTVGLVGLAVLTAAAMSWTHLRVGVTQARPPEAARSYAPSGTLPGRSGPFGAVRLMS